MECCSQLVVQVQSNLELTGLVDLLQGVEGADGMDGAGLLVFE